MLQRMHERNVYGKREREREEDTNGFSAEKSELTVPEQGSYGL